ncbi:hypothetical protein RXV95_10825 [Novosphingobium sp. ZN18A2]|uniref:hypothetical protein n=1 Tax=Novosphingobium sp. ZN18A2 TaxID=3079861 RepID=UPI0030CE0439
MSAGSRIIPIEGADAADSAADTPYEATQLADEDTTAEAEAPWDEAFEDEPAQARGGWIAPVLAGMAIAAWTGFFAFAHWPAIAAPAPLAQWADWVASWSVPVLLVLVILLVTLRTSRREAARFGDVTRDLAHHSALLEDRLRTVNTELSLARDFIASQARDLEALGRIAVDRLSGSAGQLETLIGDNGEKLDRIASVSESATENMEKLRGQLPVIANAAKDVTNNIGNAGRTAHMQLEDLVAGFHRLNEFGVASEKQVDMLRGRLAEIHDELEQRAGQMQEIATARFSTLNEESETLRARLDQDEIAALAAIRGRAEALGEELAAHRDSLAGAEREMLSALRERLATLSNESEEHSRRFAEAESTALAHWQDRAEAHAASIRQAIDALTEDHDRAVTAAAERLASFEDHARTISSGMEEHAKTAETALGSRFAAMSSSLAEQRETLSRRLEEIDTAISERRDAIADAGARAADELARKLADLDAVMEEHRERQETNAQGLAAQCDAVGERAAALAETLRASSEHGEHTARAVSQALAHLNDRLGASRETLHGTSGDITDLTDAAVRLLELIQASSDHARDHIPVAIGEAEQRLHAIDDRVMSLSDTISEAGKRGSDLSDYVLAARREVTGTISEMSSLHQTMSDEAVAHGEKIAAMQQRLAEARTESEALSRDVDEVLTAAIARLSEAAQKASADLKGNTAAEIDALAEKLGSETSEALAKVMKSRGAELVARLEEALDNAAEASRDTALAMRDQLAKVDELAGNLENRVARARERAEEQVDNDFARRAALITEALNSTAIDIAKALSADVSETAWASYLRGDRGIFTRRAVSLLDSAEAKAVQQHYENDAEFQSHVNRYIHDFEAMLRQLLSTRDGNALGVTLLSSDMGKLYVALAQGIERLRA